MEERLPGSLTAALKEWAVVVRALREGRQVILLRKGGILEAEGEFGVEARDVVLFPTFEHQREQPGTLKPCYTAWLEEEQARRPRGENVRIQAVARITEVLRVTDFDALHKIGSQHIYSEKFLRCRSESEPAKPLYCLFLRCYDLPAVVTVPLEMDYYGCRSWITLTQPIGTEGATPAMGDAAYAERVRLTKALLRG